VSELKIYGATIKVIQGDITELSVEAIVNAANNQLAMGGGVAGAIKRKGGKVIEEDAVKKGPIEIGQAVASVAGALKAKYVIHAATMAMDFKTDEFKVRSSCRNAFRIANELGLKSIALPALGCGVGGFPIVGAAKIMAQETLRHLRETKESSLKEIIFCLYDKIAFDTFERDALGYLDYIENKLKSPFATVDTIIDLNGAVVLIKRTNPPYGWAIPGGFVDYGESLEEAAAREALEETSLKVDNLKQFHTYSYPSRDSRFHTISTVYTATATGTPKADSDAADVKIFKEEDLPEMMAFDHRQILRDYFLSRKK
jgi:O-acetyl-ADP-ribose deacetylase (regulator of RNase III)/ADP-ribose pyrophosphatase YjhB (NUDIX family)